MTKSLRNLAGAGALLAATSLAVPAQAAVLPQPAAATQTALPTGVHTAWRIDDETAQRHRHWRRDRIDGGDVIAGILILGGVVAVAKAIEGSNNRRYRERDDRYRDYRDYDRNYRDRDYDRRYDRYPAYGESSRRGIDGAIEECVDAVERDERIDSVHTAERDGSGWHVEGDLRGGGSFACEIDDSGRIRDIDIDRDFSALDAGKRSVEDRRGDDYYAAARARQGGAEPDRPVAAEPGEDGREWERGEPDDRYETAEGPDYAFAN